MHCTHKHTLAILDMTPPYYTCSACGEGCNARYCPECGEELLPFSESLLCVNCQLVPEPEDESHD